tara:strand:+ start:169 stop:510 length:342 start_codon:yes stop_codon:yes gene_type:complete
MAITVTKTVTGLTILNNADKIVSEVEVTTKSVDDSNPSVLTIEATESFPVETSGGTGASGFVAYASLNQSAILDWTPVKDGLAGSNTVTNQASWIESVKNPPTPTTKSEALPF